MPPISSTATAVITQAMLARHRAIRTRIQHLEEQSNASRQQLLDLHALGADVEPGPLDLRVVVQHQRRLTAATLVPLMGQEDFDSLKSLVTPRITHLVSVVDT